MRLAILTSEDSLRFESAKSGATYLRASEIAGTKLSARLAVLSGCESALGRVTVGEGVIGLGGAFLIAGVSTVVASLWPVDDDVTATLMENFYDELANGATVSAALQQAQLALSSQTPTQHPFYWAGFVTIGSGNDTVALQRRSTPGGLTVVLFVVGLLLILVWISASRRRKDTAHFS